LPAGNPTSRRGTSDFLESQTDLCGISMESYGNKRYSSGILCYDERACGGEEDFAGHVDRNLPLIVRDGRDSLCVRVLCSLNEVCIGNFYGYVVMCERSCSPYYHC